MSRFRDAGPTSNHSCETPSDSSIEAEIEARARIAWGHDRERVEAFLRELGVPPGRIRAVLSEASSERNRAYRRSALIDLALAALVGGPMLIAWLMAARDGGMVIDKQLAVIVFAAVLAGRGASRLVFGARGESAADDDSDLLRGGLMSMALYTVILVALIYAGITVANMLR